MKPFIKGRAVIEEELERRRQRLFEGHQPELLDALRREMPTFKDAIIVNHVPEQSEDIFAVLVDTDSVAIVEIARAPIPHVVTFEVRPADEYRRDLSGRSSRQFTIALEMISV